MHRLSFLLAAAAMLAIAAAASAQTPVNGLGAMAPSTGRFYVHEMGYLRFFDGDASTADRDIVQTALVSQVAFGLTPTLSLNLDIPLVYNHLDDSPLATGDSAFGVGDMQVYGKWRFWQHDTGPTDTMRLAAIGGLQMPGGTETYWDSTGDEWNPLVGLIFSVVAGRHGGNASVVYELDTGGGGRPDGFRFDGSYLYRLAPAEYGATTSHAAWYAVAEINALYETNGNNQVVFAPGIMYEADWWTVDATLLIPIAQDLKDRPDLEIGFGVGIRFSF